MSKSLKKCTALLISFLMVLTLLPAVAWAADVSDWNGVMSSEDTEITLSASVTITEGNYDLTGKIVTFSGTATISGNVTITGGKILRGTGNTGALFKVGSGSSLTMSNITVDGQKSTVTANNPLVDISTGGTVTLGEGAVLTNNKLASTVAGEGSAVTVYDGTFSIAGGNITNNESTTDSGSTVKTYYGATVKMTNGTISDNSGGRHGGAIQLYGAQRSAEAETKLVTFTMSGGTISNNSLGYNSGVGGGVAISNTATFVMTGGTIIGNSCGSSGKGGGVAFSDGNNTSMEISGSAVIDGNKKGSSENNLEIGTNTNNLLEVTGAMSGTIGITATPNQVFTKSSNGTPSTYIAQFSSDNTGYYVADDGNGQLLLKQTTNTITIGTDLSETAAVGTELTISASAADSATVSYQWYSCTDGNKTDATAISGATNSTYTIPDNLSAGVHYYFCRVSAEGAASADSNVVKVTVEEPAVIEAKWGNTADNLTNSGALSAAFAASPAYIQLQAPVKLNSGITMTSGTITLDLNGKTITGAAGIDASSSDGVTPITVNGGTLTLIDSVGGGGITGGSAVAAPISTPGYGLKVENGTLNIGEGTSTGSFILTGGDSSANDEIAGAGLYIASGGTMTVNQAFSVKSGKKDDNYANAISSYGTFNGNSQAITAMGEIGIYGGTATGLNATVTDATDALLIGNNVTSVTITGGSYTGTRYGLWLNGIPANVVTISGGTFIGDGKAIYISGSPTDTYAGLLASGCIYTNGEIDTAITDEDTLESATKLVIMEAPTTDYTVTVTADPDEGGTASASETSAAEGTEITLTATPNTGYTFKEWKVVSPSGLSITDNKFTMPAGNVEIKAVFEAESFGTAPAITTATLPTGRVEQAYNQTLAATGDTPISWSIDSGALPGGLSLDQSTGVISGTPTADGTFTFTVKAQNSAGSDSQVFTIEIYPKLTSAFIISVSADPAGGGTASGGGTYIADATATVTATAKDGYRFVRWTENGNEVSTDAVYSFTVTAGRALVAVFEQESVNPPIYTAPSITAQPQNKSVKAGETATFTVTASGTPEPTYQWQIDRGDGSGWVDISGATQASYTTSAVTIDNDGYKYRCVITNSAGSVTSNEALLTVTEDSSENIIVEPKINDDFDDSDIPQALKDEDLDTVEKIDTALKTKIESKDSDIENTELYDVVLMYSTDGGTTWIKADESHFPASRKLLVQLPVPDGTDPATHEYIVAHMFTSDAFGKTPGNVEYPDVTTIQINGKWYLEFYVTGLSPISVGWKAAGTTPVTTYTVTYMDGVGGTVFADDVHTVYTGSATPAFRGGTPTRNGFTFTGWSPSVAATVTADATYTAQWQKDNAPVVPDPENPPVITIPATDQKVSVYVGSKATMSITATDAESYQWYVDRGNGFEVISGATGSSYTTAKAEFENDGYRYYCVAKNAYGTDTSPIFTLKVLKDTGAPATGDNSQVGLWIGLMMLSIAGLAICAAVWSRRKQA